MSEIAKRKVLGESIVKSMFFSIQDRDEIIKEINDMEKAGFGFDSVIRLEHPVFGNCIKVDLSALNIYDIPKP